MFNIKLSAFLKNIVTTTITFLLTIISMIFIVRFLAKGMGPEEFGAYSLARRIISNIALNYKLNILIGIVVAVVINFIGYDNFLFKKR